MNTKEALSRINNKHKLYLSILEKFYTNNQQFCEELRKLVETKDFETAKRVAHTFKGVTGSVGADALHNLSKSVEESIIEKDTAQFEKEIKTLDKELNSLFDNISAKLDFGVKTTKKFLNIDLVRKIIPKFRQLLTEKSPKAKALIKELEEAGLSGDKFDEMKSKLNKYDFKNALIILENIEKTLK